jgi:hypothetical protein
LLGDQASEKRMDARAGIVIPIPSGPGSFRLIIAVLRMVETPIHELREGDGTDLVNLRENKSL